MPVRPGRSDGKNVEILGGLQAGDQVATSNAFVLKAEQGKASASHTH
jgi:cobalt-zinc-cadmium efflux system membrane fusion protein